MLECRVCHPTARASSTGYRWRLVADKRPRPGIERLGLGVIALGMAMLFGGVAVAAWTGGEVFLAVMGAVGCVMTLWVGALTALRD
jgi:hypothetical protein